MLRSWSSPPVEVVGVNISRRRDMLAFREARILGLGAAGYCVAAGEAAAGAAASKRSSSPASRSRAA
jgi:hypothetical protein